jgi:hypothetical protein
MVFFISVYPTEFKRLKYAKAADTREGPGDLRSEEQMIAANRAGGCPEFKLGFAGTEGLGVLENASFSG